VPAMSMISGMVKRLSCIGPPYVTARTQFGAFQLKDGRASLDLNHVVSLRGLGSLDWPSYSWMRQAETM